VRESSGGQASPERDVTAAPMPASATPPPAPVHVPPAPQPAAGAPAPPPAPGTPTAQPQLTAALGHLRPQVDGSYQLIVQLHPADLGSVQVQAHVDQGTLTVTVACADHAARQAVQAALPQLNAQLHSAGFGALDVNIGGGQTQYRHPAEAGSPNQGGGDPRPDARPEPPAHVTRRPAPDLALDRWL
jgi:flagellar hook-length control protein FliK